MEFENRFSVDAAIEDVWTVLLDVERVAPCLPGAKVLESTGDNAYVVAMRVKVGPVAMEYKGNVRIVERDDAGHRAVLSGSGRELRGQGAAEATADMVVTREGGLTVATIKTDLKLSGRMASMGQGVIGDVSRKLVDTFAKNLQEMVAGPGAPAGLTAPNGPGPAAHDAAPAPPAPASPAAAVTAAPEEASLPIASILAAVVAGRLREPKVATVGIGAEAFLIVLYWLVRR